jgi:tetratricopeptide (TPR) repeat protein
MQKRWLFARTLHSAVAMGLICAPLGPLTRVMATPIPAEAGAGTGKPLAGKGFSLDQLENSMWTPEKLKSEKTKSDARKRKMESLKLLIDDPSHSDKADAFFRLAETHRDEARYQHFMDRAKYEAEYRCFEEKRCPEPVEPIEDQSKAIELYKKVLQADPTYKRLPEVTYYLGRATIEAGKERKDAQLEKDGEKYLKDVTTKWANDPLVPQAHLSLAEHYFDKDSLVPAKMNYEQIIQRFPKHPMFNYALYKLGWVYFNLAEFEKTIDNFHRVIGAIDNKDAGLIEFREQALNDLIQAYAEIDNGWQQARDYFLRQVGEKETYDKLDKMAALLVSKDKDLEAVDLYKHLISKDKTTPKVAEWFDAVMEVRRKLADIRETEKEVNEITAFFDPKSPWRTANARNADAIAKADDLVAGGLASMANHFHRDAQALQDKKKQKEADVDFDKAASYYARFLDRYPDHPDSYKFNFFYAEILFDRGRYMDAADQYEKTLAKDLKGELTEDAALGVVYAMESELDKLGVRQKAKGKIEIVEVSAEVKKADAEVDDAPIVEAPLHPLEERMIRAADQYVKVLQDALKDPEFLKKYPDRGKQIPSMMYIAAEIFHQKGRYRDAVTRLQVIFDLFPKDEMAGYAVNLIIDAYKRLKNWVKIEEWAREVIAKKNFTTRKQEDWEQIIAVAKTQHAMDLTRQRRYDEAVKEQQEIVDEFGKKNREVASKALFNIGAIHEIARRFPQAVEAYERVIAQYKDMEVAVQAQAAIGILYESQTEFAKAAEAFMGMQQFKTSFKSNPTAAKRAADAYRDAGILYEALEDYDRAHEVFTTYTKIYGDRPDVQVVAFQSAVVLEYKKTPEAFLAAAKAYEKIAKAYGKKDSAYELRALAASGVAYKKADKAKHRKTVEGLFKRVTKGWETLMKAKDKGAPPPDEATKAYAALAYFELAEYAYDDYSVLKVEALSRGGEFDMNLLGKTLKAKAEALKACEESFGRVLDFQDKGMGAASAYRIGKIYDEFYDTLMNAPPPPGLEPEQEDEYRFALEEMAAPAQEKALTAFTIALNKAVSDGVYNKWSRLSAEAAAKVNKDQFPLAHFETQPDKTRDTVLSTSFIKSVRRGSEVVDYLKNESSLHTHGGEKPHNHVDGSKDGAGEQKGDK